MVTDRHYHSDLYHGYRYHGNLYHGNLYHGVCYHGNLYHGDWYHGDCYPGYRFARLQCMCLETVQGLKQVLGEKLPLVEGAITLDI